MNFFEHQDQARANTQKLVGLFGLSVLSMIILIYLATIATFNLASPSRCLSFVEPESPSVTFVASKRSRSGGSSGFSGTSSSWRSRSGSSTPIGSPRSSSSCKSTAIGWWHPKIFFWVFTLTILVIGGASWYKVFTLQAGGSVIAQELGGRLLLAETVETEEQQQLLNVVEEMAIAANMKVPAVYILDNETGINAFAAGHTIDNAVIGVTRGCLEQLNRDELQGVIGHEFSHILNGDMRLNLRLIGLLHGILFVYITGRIMIALEDRDNRWLWYLGLAVTTIGLVGLFFGRLIQSAISRQREFLADASAVQFTRNPAGISGALQKIGNLGSQVKSPYADEASHMFFGNALKLSWFDDLWATHPPLLHRIRRLGGLQNVPLSETPLAGSSHASSSSIMGFAGGSAAIKPVPPIRSESWLNEVLQSEIQTCEGATAIVYALLLNPQFQTQQIDWLRQVGSEELVEQVLMLRAEVEQIADRDRLSLLDLTVPALRQISTNQIKKLFIAIQGLIKVEGRWTLSKFVVFVILQRRLQASQTQTEQFSSLSEIWTDCGLIISSIAQIGQKTPDTIAYAFRSGLFCLPGASQQEMPNAPPPSNFSELKKSLTRLGAATPKLKQAIVEACSYTVLLDNTVTDSEAELLRAVAIALDCPLPPFLNKKQSNPKKQPVL
ncbi:M48 family metallopeptidase [Phormidesmis sp. 146-33]